MSIFDLRQHLLKRITAISTRRMGERRIANGANPRHCRDVGGALAKRENKVFGTIYDGSILMGRLSRKPKQYTCVF